MKSISKKIQKKEEYYIEFTDEELEVLNIKKGDKFSWEVSDEGVLLKKYGEIEIDLKDFSKELLEFLVKESIQNDISVNEVIETILNEFIKK